MLTKPPVPSRGLFRDYEPSDGTYSSTNPYPYLTILISLTMLVLGAVWLQEHYQITEEAQYCWKKKDECWQLNDNEKYNMRDVAMVSCLYHQRPMNDTHLNTDLDLYIHYLSFTLTN